MLRKSAGQQVNRNPSRVFWGRDGQVYSVLFDDIRAVLLYSTVHAVFLRMSYFVIINL